MHGRPQDQTDQFGRRAPEDRHRRYSGANQSFRYFARRLPWRVSIDRLAHRAPKCTTSAPARLLASHRRNWTEQARSRTRARPLTVEFIDHALDVNRRT